MSSQKCLLTKKTVRILENNFDRILEYPLIKLKILDDGTLIYSDPMSNDLVKVDTDMTELQRLKGIPIPENLKETAPTFNKNRKTCFVDDENMVLWFKGINQISIVDTDQFIEQEIPNFFTFEQTWCFAIMAVADKNFKKLMGFGYNGEQEPTLHIYDMSPNVGGFSSVLTRGIVDSKFIFEFLNMEVSVSLIELQFLSTNVWKFPTAKMLYFWQVEEMMKMESLR